MRFRAMLPDWFIDVEAPTEEDAARLAREALLRDLKPESFIVWPSDRQDKAPGSAGGRDGNR